MGPDGAAIKRRAGLPNPLLDRLMQAPVLEAVVSPNLGPPYPPLLVSSIVLPGASLGSASSRQPLLRRETLLAADSEASGVAEVSAAPVVKSRPKAPGKSKAVRFAVQARAAQLAAEVAEYSQ